VSAGQWEHRTSGGWEYWRLYTDHGCYWLWREGDRYGVAYRWHLCKRDGELVWVGPLRAAHRRPPFRKAERAIERWERDQGGPGSASKRR